MYSNGLFKLTFIRLLSRNRSPLTYLLSQNNTISVNLGVLLRIESESHYIIMIVTFTISSQFKGIPSFT